mmetsp:Transcript_10768/g.30849  ORF Transcript_10768/g.30849 Transcript_10768/m.30849 type:complete len:200 (+) Transcript_10768:73-672(+)
MLTTKLHEQGLHVIDCQHLQRCGIAPHRSVKDESLLLLQLEHALFHGPFRDESHGPNRTELPKPMRSVDRLRFRGRIPPWIQQVRLVRDCQIQRHAASLQRHEEDTDGRVLLERLQRLIARLDVHSAMDDAHPDPEIAKARIRMQPPSRQIQHVHELREDQRLAARTFAAHLDQFLNQRLQLGAGGEFCQVQSSQYGAA